MKAREYNSPLIKELLDETTPEQMMEVEKQMLEQLPKYTIEKFHYKGYSIWKTVGNQISPVLILRKPKFISDEEYESFVKSLKIFYGGNQ
jgi:hypothetical protein